MQKHGVAQFEYSTPDFGESKPSHQIRALSQHGGEMGTMIWNSKGIRNIGTTPGMERRGIATAMWNEGHRVAAANRRVPAPKHSNQRTNAGDAWARSVGGSLPRRQR